MYLNLASYLFTDLEDPAALRQSIHVLARSQDMRGTVLLAPEGINVFVCGLEPGARVFMAGLRELPCLAGLDFKESWSSEQSFNRLLVKLKKEIITFRHPEYRPAVGRAASIAATTLARWLDRGCDDEGRPLALLDTRNGFEIEVGAFVGAIEPGVNAFTALPDAIEAYRPELEGKRVVTYCTGGIRCEKAALYLSANGFDNVVQLDGGVLKYFEEVGPRHWRGELFVFDRRVSLKPDLKPGNWEQDFNSRDIRPTALAPLAEPQS